MADDLNRWGFLIACGGRWDGKTIADIIRNPINIGYVRRGGGKILARRLHRGRAS